jgi:long-chain acyl-CoA synthetase
MTANRVEFVIAVHAISTLGVATVLLSPAWKAAEVQHALTVGGGRWWTGELAAHGQPSWPKSTR